MTCRCDPRSRLREVAVRDHKGVTTYMVACDECDEGRAKIEARQTAPEKAPREWKAPRPLQTLSGYERELRETQRHVPELWWKIDPTQKDRMTAEQWARVEHAPIAPIARGSRAP